MQAAIFVSIPGPCRFCFACVLSKWKIGTQWIHVSTAVDPKLDARRWVIYCIHPSIVSWFSKTKTIDFDEEQICSSPASSSHGWWLASRQTSYHEELIAKKEILLVPAHLLWLWQLSHSLTKVTDSVDSAAMNTSCVMNEPIWSIPRNNCLL